jgi:hypothetical protein
MEIQISKSKKTLAQTAFWIVVLFLLSPEAFAQNPTPDFWSCDNRVGGEWNFGRAPYACDIDALGDPAAVADVYADVLFQDQKSRTSERSRYMRVLQTVLRDMAEVYLQQRKPTASVAEKQAFERALYTLAHSESFWSHYRLATDNKIKIMRGDFGHGHGIMQVDDRWHFNAIKDGEAWDLTYNMTYGLNIFFNEWQRAASAWCVPDPNDWEKRTRSAWAAFNGGPSRLCRWTDPNDRWARNDKNFYDKYKSQSYDRYIDNYEKASVLNVRCLMSENPSQCKIDVDDPASLEGLLLKMGDSRSCILKSGSLHCMRSSRNTMCLERQVGVSTRESVDLSEEDIADFQLVSDSRMTDLCLQQVPGLYRVGDTITLNKNINFRRTPGGFRLATAPEGSSVMIVDFEVRDFASGDRYYKFQYDGEFGYVYAGDDNDYADWAEVSVEQEPEIEFVAAAGDNIQVTAPWGINLRQSIGGELIERVPNGTVLEVLAVEIQRDSLNAYYQVRFNGRAGYIYGGQSFPEVTYRNWAVVEEESETLFALKDDLYYRYLLDCGSYSCEVKNVRLLSSRLMPEPDKVSVVTQDGEWLQVRLQGNGNTGWIRSQDLVKVD